MARSEKLNRFSTCRRSPRQMLVHENAIVKIRRNALELAG